MTRSRLLWGFLIVAMAGVAVVFRSGLPPPARVLMVPERSFSYRRLPDFRLTDQGGQPFGLRNLGGRVWIADFIFTTCAGQCPRMTEQMRRLQGLLPEPIQMVSITVNPERDTSPLLNQYARENGADTRRWHFLTGDRPAIERLVLEGFLLSIGEGGGPRELITHSDRFVLVDPEGRIHGYYDGTDPTQVEQLAQDAKVLLAGRPMGRQNGR